MKRFLLISVATVAAALTCFCAQLSPEQALSRLNESGNAVTRRGNAPLKKQADYRLLSTIGNLYVFTSGQGFVVLPAEDSAPALLAYSDSDSFDPENNPGLSYWLGYYNNELEYLKSKGASAGQTRSAARVSRPEIAPLTKTEWNQEAPYNEMCPKVDGRETVTGCVATAMAQILKFHNYPEHGKGTHSYFWRPGEEELSFDYENTRFQWDLMTDRYDSKSTAESRHAVAELMLACGVSVDMHYEPGESGAATMLMGESLIDIFDYSPALWMPNRVFYGYNEWEDMIYADLAEGLPVLYSGAGTAGGHQFICDGYSEGGYFHFNWGWGGLSNGYFLLTALNPDDLGVGGGAGGFNSSQIATLGVRPPRDGDKPVYIMYNTEAFEPGVKSVKAGEDFSTTGLYFNYSLRNMPAGSRLGLKFVSSDGSLIKFVDGPSVDGYHPDDGRRNIEVKFPDLPDGTYTITPALYADGKWSAVRMPVGYASEITAVVSGGEATFGSQQSASIEITDIELPEIVYRDQSFPMPFTVRNTGSEEYYGSVTPVLTDADGAVVAESEFRPLDIYGGAQEKIGDYIAEFKAVDGNEFPAGTYSLVFRDEAGKYISAPVEVNVEIMTEETKISVTDLYMDGSNPVTSPDNVRFKFKLSCESGVYFGAPRLFVFPGDGGDDVYNRASERVYLQAGDKREMTIDTDLERLADGEYMAAVYDGDKMMSGLIRFRIDRTSGVDGLSADPKTVRVYDLNGIVRHNTLSPGVYIINGRKVLIRN